MAPAQRNRWARVSARGNWALATGCQEVAQGEPVSMRMQLRMYRIAPGEIHAFVDEWRAGVAPLRERYGFRIKGAWIVDGEDRFVGLLGYDGPESFEERDAAYYAGPERAALRPDPARRFLEAETWMLVPAPESQPSGQSV